MISETPTIEGYIKWLHGLTAQASHRISMFVAPDARLRTPEAEGTGVPAIAAIYAGLFDDAKSVTIRVLDKTSGQDGFTAYLRWDRLITLNSGQKQTLSGITEVMVNRNGKIASLIEYWDSVPDTLNKRGYFARLFNR